MLTSIQKPHSVSVRLLCFLFFFSFSFSLSQTVHNWPAWNIMNEPSSRSKRSVQISARKSATNKEKKIPQTRQIKYDWLRKDRPTSTSDAEIMIEGVHCWGRFNTLSSVKLSFFLVYTYIYIFFFFFLPFPDGAPLICLYWKSGSERVARGSDPSLLKPRGFPPPCPPCLPASLASCYQTTGPLWPDDLGPHQSRVKRVKRTNAFLATFHVTIRSTSIEFIPQLVVAQSQ